MFWQNFQIPCVFHDREFVLQFSLFSLCSGYPVCMIICQGKDPLKMTSGTFSVFYLIETLTCLCDFSEGSLTSPCSRVLSSGRSSRWRPTGRDDMRTAGDSDSGLTTARRSSCSWKGSIRPTLINEKLFPVHRPSGLKRAEWNFFFLMIFLKSFFPLNFVSTS